MTDIDSPTEDEMRSLERAERLIGEGVAAAQLEPLRQHMTVDEYEALVSMLERRCERYRHALRVIAGDEQCIDATWSNETVARVALQDLDD